MESRLDEAEASYQRLTTAHAQSRPGDGGVEARLRSVYQNQPIVPLKARNEAVFLLRREVDGAGMMYRVFRTKFSAMVGEDAIGYCHVGRPVDGMATIINAEVRRPFQRKGIAAAVYDRISADLEAAGAVLWPVSPLKMSDAEFKVWWRKSPALVFYYPHRDRLGLRPRFEFEDLLGEIRPRSLWGTLVGRCRNWLSSLPRVRSLGRFAVDQAAPAEKTHERDPQAPAA